jgi:hypothetical protein
LQSRYALTRFEQAASYQLVACGRQLAATSGGNHVVAVEWTEAQSELADSQKLFAPCVVRLLLRLAEVAYVGGEFETAGADGALDEGAQRGAERAAAQGVEARVALAESEPC